MSMGRYDVYAVPRNPGEPVYVAMNALIDISRPDEWADEMRVTAIHVETFLGAPAQRIKDQVAGVHEQALVLLEAEKQLAKEQRRKDELKDLWFELNEQSGTWYPQLSEAGFQQLLHWRKEFITMTQPKGTPPSTDLDKASINELRRWWDIRERHKEWINK